MGLGWADIGAAVVTGGTSLLTIPVQDYYNRKAAKKQNEYQYDMWQANNDYNSPASMMQRLEEAGLNPNLVYGNGGAVHQATMPTAAKVAPPDVNLGRAVLDFQQLQNMEAQENLIDQQVANAKDQGKILKAQARIQNKDAQIYEDTGVRPGDNVEKTILRRVSDLFREFSKHNFFEVMHGAMEYDRRYREKNPNRI